MIKEMKQVYNLSGLCKLLDVVFWVRMPPVGPYICMLSGLRVELFEKS